MQTGRNRDSVRPQVHKQGSDHKPTRVRTVLNEKQLHTLRTCYAANPRPDALMKEQLVEMTGLSPRVIRVWFQNKRCKDKKKSIMMKQLQQQEKVSAFQASISYLSSWENIVSYSLLLALHNDVTIVTENSLTVIYHVNVKIWLEYMNCQWLDCVDRWTVTGLSTTRLWLDCPP